MGQVLSCKRPDCSGSLTALRDPDNPAKTVSGYVCERCGVTYEAVEQPKKKVLVHGKPEMSPQPPTVGEPTGRLDDRSTIAEVKARLEGEKAELQAKLDEVMELVQDSESGLGVKVRRVIEGAEVSEEMPEQVG